MTHVFDSSAILALLWSEPGSDRVASLWQEGLMSAVNLAEVCSKLADRGLPHGAILKVVSEMPLRIVAFDEDQALKAGGLRNATRSEGLSIGDRACLALAMKEGAIAITADRAWQPLGLGIKVLIIR